MLSTTSSTTVAEDKAALRRQVRLTSGACPRRRSAAATTPCSPPFLPPSPGTGRVHPVLPSVASWAGSLNRPPDPGAHRPGQAGGSAPDAARSGRWRCGCLSRPPPGPGVLRDPGAASGRPLLARPK